MPQRMEAIITLIRTGNSVEIAMQCPLLRKRFQNLPDVPTHLKPMIRLICLIQITVILFVALFFKSHNPLISIIHVQTMFFFPRRRIGRPYFRNSRFHNFFSFKKFNPRFLPRHHLKSMINITVF